MNYKFDIPAQNKSIIKVIGVGGGGSNAVKHMHKQGIKDVEFIICNTDHQALQSSTVPNKLQIGVDLTEGLGAGAKPERGRQAALESKEQIRDLLNQGTKMLFHHGRHGRWHRHRCGPRDCAGGAGAGHSHGGHRDGARSCSRARRSASRPKKASRR